MQSFRTIRVLSRLLLRFTRDSDRSDTTLDWVSWLSPLYNSIPTCCCHLVSRDQSDLLVGQGRLDRKGDDLWLCATRRINRRSRHFLRQPEDLFRPLSTSLFRFHLFLFFLLCLLFLIGLHSVGPDLCSLFLQILSFTSFERANCRTC